LKFIIFQADFRTIEIRRLTKATEHYREHIQLLPATKALLLERRQSSAAAASEGEKEIVGNNKSSGADSPTPAFASTTINGTTITGTTETPRPESAVSVKSLAPMSVLNIMRWIVSFQMLLEMRLLAAAKSKQQQQPQHGTGVQPEASTADSHGSKYLFSCDEIIKLSQKK
jgi:hypothetical protein